MCLSCYKEHFSEANLYKTSLGIDDGKGISIRQTALNISSITGKLIAGHALSGYDTVPQLVVM